MITPLPFNLRSLSLRTVCLAMLLICGFNSVNAQQTYLAAGGKASKNGATVNTVEQNAYMFNTNSNGSEQQSIPEPAFVPYSFDKLGLTSATQPAGAYALRLLSSNYRGPLVRIAIGSNFYDVYADASADKVLSLASPVSAPYSTYNAAQTGSTATTLATVVGINSATVAIWYDQSTNARNAIQSNQALQPQIINAGTVNIANSRPALKYTGGQWLVVTTTAFNSDLSGAVVFNASDNNIAGVANSNAWYTMNGILGAEQPNDVQDFGYGIYLGNFIAGFGSPDTYVGNEQVVTNTTTSIFTWTRKSSDGTFAMYQNSKLRKSATFNAGDRTSVNSVAIGSASVGNGNNFYGTISEMVLFPIVLNTAERQAVENSQSAFFSVPILSSDATLKSLSVIGFTLDPVFNSSTVDYRISIKSNQSSLKIKAAPNFTGAYVRTYNNSTFFNLTNGTEVEIPINAATSHLNIEIDAQDGTQGNYRISFDRIPVPEVSYGTQVLALNKSGTITPATANVGTFGYGGYSVLASDAQTVKAVKKDSQGNTYVLNTSNQLFKYFANGDPRVQLLTTGQPNAIALDNTDNLYIIDNADNSLKIVTAGTTNVATRAASIGTFDKLAIANDGTAYMINIADNVVKVLPNGSSTLEDMSFDGLVTPYDIAINNKGDVYVSDSSNGQVLVYYKSEGYVDLLYYFSPVTALTIDNNNNIYGAAVADGSIYELPANSNSERLILSGDDYKQLKGITVDSKGVLSLISGLRMGVTQVVPTGGYFIDKQLPDGLSLDPATGTISGIPTQIVTSANYSITAYNTIEGNANTLTIKVLQDNANLSAIASTDIALNQMFDADVTNYTAKVKSASTSIQVTPTTAASDAVITYNGNVVASGSPVTAAIGNGANSVVFAVTSPYGTTKNYSIAITRVGAATVSYSNTVNLALDIPIDPVSPTSANIEAFGYNKIANYPAATGKVSGIKLDSAGNLYALTSAYKIKKYPADGSAAVDIATSSLMNSFTLDGQNNIYYNDLYANDIKRVDAVTGVETTIVTDAQNVYSMVVGKDGYLYFAQSNRNLVNKVAKTGGVVTQVGTGFSGPDKLAFDAAGDLYIGDHYNNKVKKVFLSTDSHIEVLPNFNSQPGAVGFDKANNLFVADYQANKLFQFTSFGSTPQLIAKGNAAQSITGIEFDKNGIIYTISPANNTIKILTPTGGYFIDKQLPKGLVFDEVTGVISGQPSQITPATAYTITGYGAFETVTSNITIAVVSNNTNLIALTVTGATISPAFDADTIAYTSSVSSTVASVDITPTVAEAGTTITYNGSPVTSGSAVTVPLVSGSNSIPLIVTAAGGATKTYTLTINKLIPPTVDYGTAHTFALDEPISPVTPSSTNVGALGYNAPAAIGKSIGSGFIKAVVDSAGNTYLISSSKTTIQVIPASGAAAYEIGGPFNSPVGMAIDKAGNLYVAERTALYKVVSATGITTPVPDITLASATSIAAGDDGNLYIVNRRRIYKYEIGTGNFNEIDTRIAGVVNIAAKGNTLFYSVLLSTQQAIFRMSLDGSNRSIVTQPDGFAVDGDLTGHVYGGGLNDISRYGGDDALILNVGAAYNLSTDLKGNIYYAATQDSLVKKLTPSGGYFIDKELPSGLALNAATGIISGTPQALSPAATYTVTAYSGTQSVVSSFTLATVVNNRDLSALTVSGTTIGDSFNADTISYNAVTAASLDSITITPTAAAAGSTITCNGITVASGSAIKVPVVTGANTFALVVTSEFGTAKTYTLNIKRGVRVSLDYGPEQTFTINKAITAITPAATNVLPWGYNNPRKKFRPELFGSHFLIGLTDSAGTTYVATINPENGWKSLITVVPANGAPAYQIGGEFQYINAAIMDKDGNLYVTEDGGGIYKIIPSTNTRTRIAFTIDNPQIRALALDDNGRLYIGDARNGLYILDQTTGIAAKVEGTKATFTIAIYDNYIFYNDFGVLYRSELNGNNKVTITAPGSEQLVSFFDPAGYYYTGKTFVQRVGKKEYALDPNRDQVIKGFIRVPPTFGIGGTGIDTSTPQGSLIDYTASIDGKGRFLSGLTNATVLLDVPSGGYYIDKRLPPGMDFDAETGIISGTPTKSWPKTNYHITAYNEQENAVSTFTLGVENDLKLANLITDAGNLTPAFSADSTSYHLTVNNGTTSASITATLSDTTNRLSIGGATATSGTLASIALNAGDNAIPVVVTAADNSSETYTVNIHRISNDYQLHNLTVNAGTLSPDFDANTNDYVVVLPYGTASVTITPTANSLATIKVADVPVLNGQQSQPLNLNTGDNNIIVNVTAEDGTSATNYTVNLRVVGPSSVSLSGLTLSAGTLNPAFSAGTTNYQVSVPAGTSAITVHPVVADALSVATVNGAALDGASGSVNVPLNNGINVIAVSVLANDGTTTNSYTITVNKLIPAPTSTPVIAQVYTQNEAITPLAAGFSNVAAPGYFALADTISKAIPTPTGIAINKAGDLFIADITAGAIYKLPVGGGAPVTILTGLNNPLSVATDANGNVYAAALGNSRIKKVTPSGTVTSIGSGLSLPTGLTVDNAGNIYVAETANHAVKKITQAGVTTTLTTDLSFPYGISTDAAGNIYVADNSAGTIVRFNATGGARNVLISGLSNPTDVKLDPEGNIYVNQGGASTVTRFDKNGLNPVVISTGYAGLFGIAIGQAGKLYTTDNERQTIEKLTPSGGYYLSNPLPDGLEFDMATGVISGTPTAVTAAKDYTITAYNTGGSTSSVVNIKVLLPSADLANLVLSAGALSPAFSSGTINYTATVSNSISEITLTPTADNVTSTIKVNNVTIANGATTNAIQLTVGSNNIINVVVTAADGATKTYKVTVRRDLPSSIAGLSLALSPYAKLKRVPANGADVNFEATVANSVASVTLTPIPSHPFTAITVNNIAVEGGAPSGMIPLNYGPNIIDVTSVAENGINTRTYRITVFRANPGSSDAGLSIVLSPAAKLTQIPPDETAGVTTDVNFTATVANSVSSITVTPTPSQANATVTVNGIAVAAGMASQSLPLNIGNNVINVIGKAQDGYTTRIYRIIVTRIGSGNAGLSMVLSPYAKLTQVPANGADVNFTASVANSVATITVTPTPSEANATITVNGIAVAAGTASQAIPLSTGENIINVIGTAQNGTNTRSYRIAVTRAVSSNAGLSLVLSPVTKLTQVTANGADVNFTASVANSVSTIMVIPTPGEVHTTITVNGIAVAAGTSSGAITLNASVNNIDVIGTAQDGTTTRKYRITVTRAPAGSNIAGLSVALSPYYKLTQVTANGADVNFTVAVPSSQTSISALATPVDANATITINGIAVAAATPSGAITLNVGDNVINVIGTAQNGTTTRRYRITVNRASALLMVDKNDSKLLFANKAVNPAAPSDNDGVVVHQGVSPNGDGSNDILSIEGISAYPNNKITIMNTNGTLVFEVKDYGKDGSSLFDGHSNKTGAMLKPGTYFYSLEYKVGDQNKRKTGYIVLKY